MFEKYEKLSIFQYRAEIARLELEQAEGQQAIYEWCRSNGDRAIVAERIANNPPAYYNQEEGEDRVTLEKMGERVTKAIDALWELKSKATKIVLP